jgi:hypothetical protein
MSEKLENTMQELQNMADFKDFGKVKKSGMYGEMPKIKIMTAVEWFIQQICGEHTEAWKEEIQQALIMEKEQIKYAWLSAWKDSMIQPLEDKYYMIEAEQYYNETYGK